MSRRQFRAANRYNGLEEAIQSILEESDDEAQYDLSIIPPDPSVITDEEEGPDDDIIQTASMPQDVPGSVEVFVRTEGSLSSENDSDDEPLAAKRSRRNDQPKAPVWRKCSPTYSSRPYSISEVVDRQTTIKQELKDLSPVQIFEKLFDEEIVEFITSNSKLYANQNNRHTFQLDHFNLLVSNAMSRNMFRDIKRNIHLADNNVAISTSDKMFKVRAFGELLMKKYLQWGVFHENISIDKSMVKYFGHHPAKQFIRGKPVRFGYKNWVAASSTGYCYTFDFYCGKSINSTDEPLGTRVVKTLLEKFNTNPINHTVFFDNFFTSHILLIDLRELGYRATGTLRENRTKKCPLVSTKDMKKKERAAYDYRFDKSNELLIVRWKDNSVCTMATNYDTIEPTGTVKRWCPVKREKTDVLIPNLFQTYNRCMGGVDELDQSISLYRIGIHGKKWWWVLFTYMVDMTIANAWRLHSLGNENRMDQLLFRRTIARTYLRQGPQVRSHPSTSIVPGMAQDGMGHFPKKLEKQLRCVVCHSRVKWECKKCCKTLCVEKSCFEKFHL